MNKRISFIDELLKQYDIALFELSQCYEKNKESIDNAKKIFECKDDFEINLVLTVPELICPDIAKELQNQVLRNMCIRPEGENTEEELYKLRLWLITAMYFNPTFFVYLFNWCYFLEYDVANAKKYVRPYAKPEKVTEGMSASSDEEAIKEIGKKEIIENCGEFWITGHEENGVQITTFHFKFYNPKDKLTVSINYRRKDDEDCSTIKLNSADLKEGKTILKKDIENLNYEKGFVVDLYISKN